MYVYVYVCMYIYIYIWGNIFQNWKLRSWGLTKKGFNVTCSITLRFSERLRFFLYQRIENASDNYRLVESRIALIPITAVVVSSDRDRFCSENSTTRYGLNGPGIESWWGRAFPHSSRPALRPTQPLIQCVAGLSREVKRPGCGVDHPPHLAPRLKKE